MACNMQTTDLHGSRSCTGKITLDTNTHTVVILHWLPFISFRLTLTLILTIICQTSILILIQNLNLNHPLLPFTPTLHYLLTLTLLDLTSQTGHLLWTRLLVWFGLWVHGPDWCLFSVAYIFQCCAYLVDRWWGWEQGSALPRATIADQEIKKMISKVPNLKVNFNLEPTLT